MSSEVNPNKPIEQEPTQDVKPGEAVDFDTVEAVTEDEIEAAKTETAKQKKEAKDQEERQIPKEKEPEKKLEKVEGEGTEKPGDEKPPEPKLIKIENEGKAVEVSDSAIIAVPVDGKLEKVTLGDLRGNFAGKVAWDKRFNELNVEKQTHKKDVEEWNSQKSFVNEKVNEILELAKTDQMSAFFSLCQMNGTTPEEQVKAWEKFAEEANDWMSLSPEEQKAKLAIKERDFYKSHISKQQDRDRADAEKAQLAEQADNLRQEYGLTEEEFAESYEIAKKVYPQNHQIGAREAVTANRLGIVHDLVLDVASDSPEEEQSSLISTTLEIVMTKGNEQFTRDDIKDILEVALDKKAKADTESGRKVSRKLSDAEDSQTAPIKPQNEEIFTSFEQL